MSNSLFSILVAATFPSLVTCGAAYIWPLLPDLINAEVKSGGTLIKDACAIGQGQGHPSLDYSSAMFWGNPESHVDLQVTGTSSLADFSFSFVLGNPLPAEATILHYQQDKTVVDIGIDEVILSKNETHFNYLMIGFDNSRYESSAAIADCFPTTLGQDWLPMAVAYNRGKRLMTYVTMETILPTQRDLWQDFRLGLPGTVRVATTMDLKGVSYMGRISCVQMWNKDVNYNDIAGELIMCRTNEWSNAAPTFVRETNTCSRSGGHFRRVARGSSPNSVTISVMPETSKILCATLCDRTPGCDAFTFTGTVCSLFNNTVTWGLINSPGADFYIKSNRCC